MTKINVFMPGQVVEISVNDKPLSRVVAFAVGKSAILNDGTLLMVEDVHKYKINGDMVTSFLINGNLVTLLRSIGAFSPVYSDVFTGDVLLILSSDTVSAELKTVAVKDARGKRCFAEDGEVIDIPSTLVAFSGYNREDFCLTEGGRLEVEKFFPRDI